MNAPRRITSTPERPWQPGAAPVPAGTAQPGLSLGLPAGPPIAGFGGCFNELGWQALLALPEAERGQVLDLLFQPGCALSSRVCRLPMGASDYALAWHSYDEVDGDYELRHFSIARDRTHLLPYVREALARNPELRLFASPWSPPTWLKHPKAYNFGTLRPEPAVLRTYADYFLKYVRAYAAEGIPIAQVHVQNEPVADQKFPSCRWTGAQLRDFIRARSWPGRHRTRKSGWAPSTAPSSTTCSPGSRRMGSPRATTSMPAWCWPIRRPAGTWPGWATSGAASMPSSAPATAGRSCA